jgi:hypothetical protein
MQQNARSVFPLQIIERRLCICIRGEKRGSWAPAVSPRGQLLYLTHGHPAAGDSTRDREAFGYVLNGKESAPMAGRELPFFEEILDGRFQFQQAQRVCNRGAILAGSLGNLLLRKTEFVGKPLKSASLLDRVQVFALEVFNQRHLQRHLFRHVPHDDRNAA